MNKHPARRTPTTIRQRIFASGDIWREHRGVRVSIATFNEWVKQTAFTKVFAAIDVLHDVAPLQLERIPTLTLGINVLVLGPVAAEWNTDLGVCMLDQAFVVAPDTTAERLAVLLVHELTHARLEHAGFRCDGQTRARIERICYLAQRNVVLRLPFSEERMRLEHQTDICLQTDPAFWSDEQVTERLGQMVASWPLWRRVARRVVRLAFAQDRIQAR